MQSHLISYQGSSVHTFKFKVDSSILLEGVEMCISNGPTELLLRVSECRQFYQRPLQCLGRVFKAEANRDRSVGLHRSVHVSFQESIVMKSDRLYAVHATLKGSDFHPQIRRYRDHLSFDGMCLSIPQKSPDDFENAIFTAISFRNMHNAIRRKIPVTF